MQIQTISRSANGYQPVAEPQPVCELLIIDRNGDSSSYLMTKKQITLGRGEDNDVVLDSKAVSRHHLRVELRGNDLMAMDLNSVNGSYLSKKRISKTRLEKWHANNSLRLGNYTLLWRPVTTVEDSLEIDQTIEFDYLSPIGKPIKAPRLLNLKLKPYFIDLMADALSSVLLEIRNEDATPHHCHLEASGDGAQFLHIPADEIVLEPMRTARITLVAKLPSGIVVTPRKHSFILTLRSIEDDSVLATVQSRVEIGGYETLDARIEPQLVRNGDWFHLIMHNGGNRPAVYKAKGNSSGKPMRFRSQHRTMILPAGGEEYYPIQVSAEKRHLIGLTKKVPFSVNVTTASGSNAKAESTLLIPPLVPLWMVLGATMLASSVAAILYYTL